MRDLSLRDWEVQLRTLGGRVEPGETAGAPQGFASWRRGSATIGATRGKGADELLWRCVANGDDAWRDAIDLQAGRAPLFGELRAGDTIEVCTECELSGLHALDRLALRERNTNASDRALDAARWHLEHTQPDNATNRPWAVHVFLALAKTDASPDARLYAETLMHNCMVSMGRPDPLSAEILRDAADALAEHIRLAAE